MSKNSRKPKALNPLQKGIQTFIQSLPTHQEPDIDPKHLPKRFTIYPPLLLLPTNFPSHPPQWTQLYNSLDPVQRHLLYKSIANSFHAQAITHIAINSPISVVDEVDGTTNITRSPSGLLPLLGDFGPAELVDRDVNTKNNTDEEQATCTDFQRAFWVGTVQNDIFQTWAPRWTMFSRGNVTEKARILGEYSVFPGLKESEMDHQCLKVVDVVDFYVGIGYFAFSYVRRGVRRVWGWELNGWSVQALVKGVQRNGWDAVVVRVESDGHVDWEVVERLVRTDEVRIVVFHGDNRWAGKVMGEIEDVLVGRNEGHLLNVRHVNLGLLPSSAASWSDAVRCLDTARGGWVHVHENVDVEQINTRASAVVIEFQSLVKTTTPQAAHHVSCVHIEHVKTYAPGVMHCVFDIQIIPTYPTSSSFFLYPSKHRNHSSLSPSNSKSTPSTEYSQTIASETWAEYSPPPTSPAAAA